MKIDVFPHILPRRYFDRMLATAPAGLALQKRMSGIPVLTDVELRLRIMDRYEGPFDPEQGPGFIRDTIAAMERMRATDEERRQIYETNARRLLRFRREP
ncbi:MAG: hypothetical protein HYR51_18470 [Candidatus Rokubacteria bacterium]|nr:hypothetical protein [Candidatus Rokubacteria bacterium]